MLLWNKETIDALLAMGQLFPHLMFVGDHEHELHSALRDFLTHLGRATSDSDVLVHECETNGGIAAIRDVLRPFTRGPRHARPALVILRHFDRLSPDAQFALRRTMEIEQDKCRCLAISTTTASIIQPLHSRFVMIKCGPGETSRDGIRRPLASRCATPGVDAIAAMGVAAAMSSARGGVAVSDVLGWLAEHAEHGRVPWRVVVAATHAAHAVKDEAAGLYLAGQTCADWLRGRELSVYAS